MQDIPLKNGKTAKFRSTKKAIIKDIDTKNPIDVHSYLAPCPLCDISNVAFSYDGYTFVNFQMMCKNCGIFYRPVIDPKHLAGIDPDELYTNKMEKQKYERELAVKQQKEIKSEAQVRKLFNESLTDEDKW